MRYGELSRRKEPNPTGLFDGAYKDAADASAKLPDNQRQNPLNYKAPAKQQAPKPTGGYSAPAVNPNQTYIDQLNSLYDQVMGRGKFQYDLNGDMLYKQMADQYTQLGRQAMRDATGTAAGLTGGYGNTWANYVGNQAYQQYLTQLNNNIPELYDRAYNAWLNEGNELLQQYELAANHPAVLGSLAPKSSGGGGGKKQVEEITEEEAKDEQGGYWSNLAALTKNAIANSQTVPKSNPLVNGVTVQTATGPMYLNSDVLKEYYESLGREQKSSKK